MPVAALIVVRPGMEGNAIESDSLRADPDRWHARADVAVESGFCPCRGSVGRRGGAEIGARSEGALWARPALPRFASAVGPFDRSSRAVSLQERSSLFEAQFRE
jgi:hypothetical protein